MRITDAPMHLNDIAQNGLDANDVGEAAAFVSVEEGIYAPDEALAEYRFRFNSQRQKLVRERVLQLIGEIDAGTAELVQTVERDGTSVDDNPTWASLRANISEVSDWLAVRFVGRADGQTLRVILRSLRASTHMTSLSRTGPLYDMTSRELCTASTNRCQSQ
jgi:hypothetical protein